MGNHDGRPRSVWWAVAATVAGVLLVGGGAYGVVALNRTASTVSGSPTAGPPSVSPDGAEPGVSGSPSARPSTSASAGAKPSASPRGSIKPSGGGTTCTLAGGTSACPAAPPVKAAAGKQWKLTFDEEFNGGGYSKSKLTPCFDWNYGDCTSTFNTGREHYDPAQVKVSGGTAKLVAAPLSPAVSSSACQNGSCTYKSGLLSTARPNAGNGSGYLYKFTYGYVEGRIKVPATQGFFTAFWMLPADPSFDYKYEIDILEMMGDDPTTMYMTYHYNNRSRSYPVNTGKYKNGSCATKDYSKNFVRMGLDWQPDHVAWYIDGKKCGAYKGSIANVPMQLILDLMVDTGWQRDWNVGLKDPTLTRQLEVDYLRVYQQVAS